MLRPGDLLYLPPGAWHVAQAIGSSLALTLRAPRHSIAALSPRLFSRRMPWRRGVPLLPLSALSAGRLPEKVSSTFERAWRELRRELIALDPEELSREWYRRSSLSIAPAPGFGSPEIRPTDWLSLQAPLLYRIAKGGRRAIEDRHQGGGPKRGSAGPMPPSSTT